METTRTWLYGLMLVAGLALLALAGQRALATRRFLDRAVETTGTVVSIEVLQAKSPGFRPLVRFSTPSGEERLFRGGTESRSFGLAAGANVPVLYDSENPADARVRSSGSLWRLPIFLALAGLVLASSVIPGLLVPRSRARRGARLRVEGTPVQAVRKAVTREPSSRMLGRTPWRISCEWRDPATGRVHTYVSRDLWVDPTPYLHGDRITVFIDPRRPRRYAMDLSFLPSGLEPVG